MKHLLAFTICALGITYAFSQQVASYPYQNPELPVEKRVKDLLERMTLHEKILQLQHIQDAKTIDTLNGFSYGSIMNTNSSAAEVAQQNSAIQTYLKNKTRLGIPVLTITEALHGVYQGGCTIYPQAIALGSTFNPMLVSRMVDMISLELNALSIKQVLAPDLDIARELRWGRVEETYGEDPFLIAQMGIAYAKTARKNNIISTPKHFVAHGTPSGGLNLSSVFGGERDLRSLYLYPFGKVIKEAKPGSLMNAYSSYDGVTMAASYYYLTDLLRNELGFTGYVISDWETVVMLKYFQHTAANNAEAGKQAIKAGIDLEASSTCYLELEKMVQNIQIDIKYIDQAVGRVLRVKFESGLFDKPLNEGIDLNKVIHSTISVALAKEIADESMVLLKNDKSILPLSQEKHKSIAVIGPNAGQFRPGDYTWSRTTRHGISALQGIKSLVGENIQINYAKGCETWSQNKDGFAEAIDAATKSDVAILIVGTESGTFSDNDNVTCGEGFDLSDLKLPGVQEELIKEVKATGKPIIVILISGKPLAVPWVKENADAVLIQFYGGEQQGNTLADVLFGKVNPSGRLNVSFPQSVGHLPCYYNYKPTDKGFYQSPGSIDGKEVVQLYVRDVVSSVVTPVKQLKAFSKVLVKAGEAQIVRLTLPISELALFNQQMKKVVEPGEFELQIGAASDDIKIVKKLRL